MKKIVLLFPGQGSQYIGMGQSLYNEFSAARQIYEEANDALGYDLSKICFEGSFLKLNQTDNMLLAIFTTSVATFRIYMQEIGIVPEYLAGHSLGEYSALACAGFLQFSDCLKLLQTRCRLAQEIVDQGVGAMTVINNVKKEWLEHTLQNLTTPANKVSVACYNSDDQFVIAGNEEAVRSAEDRIAEYGAQITPMLMSPPFHCSIMEEAAVKLEEELSRYKISNTVYPVISNATAKPTSDSNVLTQNIIEQMTKPVLWKDTIDFIENENIGMAVEIGPQSILTNLLKNSGFRAEAVSFIQKEDRQRIIEAMKPVADKKIEDTEQIERRSFYQLIISCLAEAVSTKNRNWNEEEYETGVIIPYEEIEKLVEAIEKENKVPDKEQVLWSLERLKKIFETKKIPLMEQRKRFQKILKDEQVRSISGVELYIS